MIQFLDILVRVCSYLSRFVGRDAWATLQQTSKGEMLKAEERSAQRSNGWLEGIADPVRFAVVQVLVGTGTATIADLAESCGASVPTIRRHLAALIATGIVAEEDGSSDGCTVGRPASRYKLPKHVRSSAREILDVGGSVVSS